MEQFIEVLKALNKLQIIFLFIASIIALIKPVFSVYIVFMLMVYEDYKEKTVDMRLYVFLVTFMIFASKNLFEFVIVFIIGMLFFGSICLVSVIILDGGKVDIKANTVVPKIKTIAFLPAIALSIVIFLMLTNVFELEIFKVDINYYYLFFTLIVCFLFAQKRYKHVINKAKQKGADVIIGFGDGDVFICSAWTAFLGVEEFYLVFTIATIVQIMCYLAYYLKERLRDNGI